MNEQLFETDRL